MGHRGGGDHLGQPERRLRRVQRGRWRCTRPPCRRSPTWTSTPITFIDKTRQRELSDSASSAPEPRAVHPARRSAKPSRIAVHTSIRSRPRGLARRGRVAAGCDRDASTPSCWTAATRPPLARFWAAALEWHVAPYDEEELARLASKGIFDPEDDPTVMVELARRPGPARSSWWRCPRRRSSRPDAPRPPGRRGAGGRGGTAGGPGGVDPQLGRGGRRHVVRDARTRRATSSA
mgnify:CR=1 FL=1